MEKTNQQSQKPNPKKLNPLEDISEEDLARVERAKLRQNRYKVDNEWLLLAEFAKAYGWQAYIDVKEDRVDTAEMMTLIEANRKLEAMDMLRDAQTAFIGAGASRARKPSQTFKQLVRNIIKDTKVDEL